jgi:hypothetical protein
MSDYYTQTYEDFIRKHEQAVLNENKYLKSYTRKWNKAVQRLKESGADLSKIRIVERK